MCEPVGTWASFGCPNLHHTSRPTKTFLRGISKNVSFNLSKHVLPFSLSKYMFMFNILAQDTATSGLDITLLRHLPTGL